MVACSVPPCERWQAAEAAPLCPILRNYNFTLNKTTLSAAEQTACAAAGRGIALVGTFPALHLTEIGNFPLGSALGIVCRSPASVSSLGKAKQSQQTAAESHTCQPLPFAGGKMPILLIFSSLAVARETQEGKPGLRGWKISP